MPDRRPSPEQLLERAREEETQKNGKLKIYLGAAPGVGKTHTMLGDALARREQGLDVVAGVVESHGRKEIDALLQGIEILPRRIVEYHGKPLLEFDLDAALSRDPGLILIDEMAHTNIPGLRHAKRWQDIKELLDRGIDVYTTLNVQHIESLNDIIAQIVGIKVRETVPDSLLEMADTIELVDLPPDDLLKRLQDGKVYVPTQAELATQHFFRKGNLTALRELALRFTAEHVDEEVLLHRRGQGIEQTWPTTERLLVCIGSDPGSAKVIRAARRMASSLHADWIAIHVEAPRLNLSEEQRNHAIQNLRLAEQLGAETRILTGIDVVKEIIEFAREHNVTKIVVNKRIRPHWKELIFGSLVEELIRHSGEIDVYIIRGESTEDKPKQYVSKVRTTPWKIYGLALIMVTISTVVGMLLYPLVESANLIMIYLLGVVVVAMRGRVGPSILASVLSSIVYTYIFVTPRFDFAIPQVQYVVTLLIMMLVAQIISHLTILTRQQAEIAHLGEQRTAALHTLTRQLASTRGTDKLLEIGMSYISDAFDGEVLALLSEHGELKVRSGSVSKKIINSKDLGVAQWVYDLGQIAGLGTDTLPFSDALYVPLLGSHGPIGVLKVRPRNAERLLIPEQLRLLEACASQIALALEVDRLQEKARESQIAIETERLRTALFNSISHELQNPLAEISRQLTRLKQKDSDLSEEMTQELIQQVYQEAERLHRLIDSLLQITQLEEGKIKLNKQLFPLIEVINAACHRIENKLKNRSCEIQLSDQLPPVLCDKILMEQVVLNLIENAIMHTPADSPIEISASLKDENILFAIADRGPGLMLTDIEHVFDKFYRGQSLQKEGGSGLGLSICQSIIKAHGGKIWAENRWDGGAIFYFVLPLRQEE